MVDIDTLVIKNNQFQTLICGDENCNSFLFESEDKLFLDAFALNFAKFLLCKGGIKPCGSCDGCVKVGSFSHADLCVLPKGHKVILVEDILTLIENAYLTPMESDKKVFILQDFSNATVQAQNKLLKILEEPPKSVYIILNVLNISKVLPTVLSRCKKLRLSALDKTDIKEVFPNISDNELEMSAGSLTRAKTFLEDNSFNTLFADCLDTALHLKNSAQMLKYSSKILLQKNKIDVALDIFESLYRDMLLINLGQEKLVSNKSLTVAIFPVAQEFSCDALDNIIKKIYDARARLVANCNPQGIIDNLLLYILEVKFLCKK